LICKPLANAKILFFSIFINGLRHLSRQRAGSSGQSIHADRQILPPCHWKKPAGGRKSARMRNSLDIDKPEASTRVVVAMSGGVDSSVVACLLKEQGYDVVGVTLQLYDQGEAAKRKGACCAGQDIYDASIVAERMGFPHYVLDYEDRFRESVIERFADSYVAGETPIPCVECNKSVKFRDLLAMAKELGADALATGHYVESRPLQDGRRALYRAMEAERDQSYFLYATTQSQLDLLRFPLGARPKSETRRLARDFGLEIADKPDSQDICFVPNGRYSDIIEKLRPDAAQPGEIVHEDGRTIGTHRGVMHYTIGQRRGLGIAAADPLYVVKLDAARRQVIVGPRSSLRTTVIKLRDVNWLGDLPLPEAGEAGLPLAIRVRSSRAPKPATLFWRDGAATVELAEGEEGVAPGQACVFYEGEDVRARVLGGGVIEAKPAISQPLAKEAISRAGSLAATVLSYPSV
jgi:tRNA-uridine 2-sulfurtransferase